MLAEQTNGGEGGEGKRRAGTRPRLGCTAAVQCNGSRARCKTATQARAREAPTRGETAVGRTPTCGGPVAVVGGSCPPTGHRAASRHFKSLVRLLDLMVPP
ncbi:hypothetical protein KIN20_023041 [Parelaphostrongylus tenuis]|uniref:Uncharacterized protein n=1 Tax=Parelaphostrongylus tenuis TaxID=148309 RepID=A0AAD5QX47_PARTN|nr:hypothetical protein KIN20_023041 [Parelaphostrongylus tenuis]